MMSWSSLPDDVVELILTSLPLVELARVSTTCSTFQALYRRQLAQEHEARCNLAINYFGGGRITSFTALIIQLLKGEPLESVFADWGTAWKGITDGPGATIVSTSHFRQPGLAISLDEDGLMLGVLEVYIPQDHKGVGILVYPRGEGFESVALVQAILREGLAQFIHDAGLWARIDILYISRVPAGLPMLRREGLKAQIGPLMQFASRCISMERIDEDVGEWAHFKERLQLGQVASAAEEATD